MIRHRLLGVLLLLLISQVMFAQTRPLAIVKGTLINAGTRSPLYDIKVTIPELNVSTLSNGEGAFSISDIPYGDYKLVITGASVLDRTLDLHVNADILDLSDLLLTPSDKVMPADNAEIPTIAIEDNNGNSQDDDASIAQGSSGMFLAGEDPFVIAATYTFGQYYFKPRGVNQNELQINGIAIDDLERGYTSWGPISGLNDVLHGRNITYGLQPSGFGYGDLNGLTYIDATATEQRKGNTLSYSRYNRNYNNRLMFTHSSGLLKNGWAWSVSGSRRWAKEGYTPGTFYDAHSAYAGVSKQIGKGQINLTAIGNSTVRGKALNAAEESYELANDNQYNPAWGYQEGKKRNSRVADVKQPIIILNYTLRPSDKTRWNTALGYQFGPSKNSTIDFYNAYSPRPNYYRNLPSYYYAQSPQLTAIGDSVKAFLQMHPELMQVDWNGFYQANYKNTETMHDVDGIAGNNVTGRRSLYILSNYVDKLSKTSFNTNIEHAANEKLTIAAGLRAVSQKNENYRQAADLLGGDFYVNTYQFLNNQNLGNQNYAQNDLNHPNKLIKKGDKYGYDYIQTYNQGEIWGQATGTLTRFDLFGALNLGYTSFFRDGKMRNGLFPDHSYGKSEALNFLTYRAKGGITYKIDLHHAIYANADYTAEAPLMSNTYISIATRDYTVSSPTTVKKQTTEIGYVLKTRKIHARVTGYVSDVRDNTIIQRFFYDETGSNAFVSYILNKLSTRSTGLEFAANYKMSSLISFTAAAAIGQYFYTNSPDANIYLDNDPTVNRKAHKVYISNFYVGGSPQSIYTFAVKLHPKRWNVNVNFNYIDRNYITIYPERRTAAALDLVPRNSALWNSIVDQEKLPGAFTTDLYISRPISTHGLSKALHRSTSIFLSVGITNVFNKKDIKLSGYEQLRYDFENRSPDKFSNFYDYAFGTNFSANLTFRF